MELELKHLSPYLPYGLKILYHGEQIKMNAGQGSSTHWIGITATLQRQGENCKPILRPLSDVSKKMCVNGEEFVPLVKLLKLKYPKHFELNKNNRYSEVLFDDTCAWIKFSAPHEIKVFFFSNDVYTYPQYWVVEKLFEWHFDVFGLIPIELAVDINTL